MCELLVGLPDVNVEGVDDWPRWLRIAIATRGERPMCPACDSVLSAQLADVIALRDDANERRWTKERVRHERVANALTTHLRTIENRHPTDHAS